MTCIFFFFFYPTDEPRRYLSSNIGNSGSVVLSRVISYMGERVKGSVFIGVGYAPPPMSFNQAGVEAINNASLDTLGYPPFGYWYFMNEDDVAPIMDKHVSSSFCPIAG